MGSRLRRWLMPRRCPKCGGRLRRLVAHEETVTQKVMRTERSSGRFGGSPLIHTEERTIVPVYMACERCEYRRKRGGIRTS